MPQYNYTDVVVLEFTFLCENREGVDHWFAEAHVKLIDPVAGESIVRRRRKEITNANRITTLTTIRDAIISQFTS